MAKDDLVLGGISFGPTRLPLVGAKGVAPITPIKRHSATPPVRCKVVECPMHRGGMCTLKSGVIIGEDGRCEFGVKAREREDSDVGRTP